MEKQINNLAFTSPNRAWVVTELDKLLDQWLAWESEVAEIAEQPYDKNTQLNVFADGEGNMEHHDILQAKTLTFLNNNLIGHGFVKDFDDRSCDRTDLRLKIRVKHRLKELRILKVCLEYARVPESYWREKGKELLDKIVDKGSETAIDVAASYLKNPMGGGDET